ncbi:MAG: hypothetical protein ACRCTE_01990 [Cellulosilyticaceae bacterium]
MKKAKIMIVLDSKGRALFLESYGQSVFQITKIKEFILPDISYFIENYLDQSIVHITIRKEEVNGENEDDLYQELIKLRNKIALM